MGDPIMSHTPEQANELWCPMVRIGIMPHSGGPSAVNDPDSPFNGRCVADSCAMWRWEHEIVACKKVTSTTHGYCGLAGKP